MSIQLQGNDESTFANSASFKNNGNDVTFRTITSNADRRFAILGNESEIQFEYYRYSPANSSFQIKCPGTTGDSSDDLVVFAVAKDGGTTATIKQSGAATFGGTVSARMFLSNDGNDNAGLLNETDRVNLFAQDKPFFFRDTSVGDAATVKDVLQVGFFDANVWTANVNIKSDGSATFAGNVDVGGSPVSGSNPGVKIHNNGSITVARPDTGNINNDPLWLGYESPINAITSRILSNGNATFANTFFNLEADDDTKYTATTDADGNETLVYNGPTLDVKERLQNTRALLLRLKAALILPDADVNTLRARLLEAFDILTLEGDEE